MDPEYRYFIFPVSILSGAFQNINEVCQNAVKYSFYEHANKLTGTMEQRTVEASEYFHVNGSQTVYEEGKILFESIPTMTPKVSLKAELVKEYYENPKDEFDIVLFMAFSALRSILGKRAYCKTNNKMMLARMAGMSNTEEILNLPETLRKYANRYQLEKIKQELMNKWKLNIYGRYTRGFYVSFNLTLDQLVYEAEKRRKSYTDKSKKLEVKLSIEKAFVKLYPIHKVTTP